jgi:hypothetical protein
MWQKEGKQNQDSGIFLSTLGARGIKVDHPSKIFAKLVLKNAINP